jgi:hypothetical protein
MHTTNTRECVRLVAHHGCRALFRTYICAQKSPRSLRTQCSSEHTGVVRADHPSKGKKTMRKVQQWMPAMLLFVVGACADTQNALEGRQLSHQDSALSTERSETEDVYLLERDRKMCAAPRCSGFYVSRVNHDELVCADGKMAKSCYVAEVHFANGLSAEHGELVRGRFETRKFERDNLTLAVLEASAAFSPLLKASNSTGYYLAPYDTGLRCITTPCDSLGVLALNSDVTRTLSSVSFARRNGEENATLEQALYQHLNENIEAARATSGNLVFGKLEQRYDARAKRTVNELKVQNVFVPKTVPHAQCLVYEEGTSVTAWNVSSDEEAEQLSAELSGKVTLSEGACADVRSICPMMYRPVHGVIDALGEGCSEKSNACAFRGAVIAAAGENSKAGGSYAEGSCPNAAQEASPW